MARVIKRYENRKLYDTEARRYVSLQELAELIRRGVDVQVIDNKTNEDITAQTLTQVILEEGKRGRNPLSKEMLHDIIRWGNSVLDDSIHQLRQRVESLLPTSVSRLFSARETQVVEELREKVDMLEQLVSSLIEEKQSNKKAKAKQTPTKKEE